jgi:CO/xanthine dehydrogenase Mo-binding subunit
MSTIQSGVLSRRDFFKRSGAILVGFSMLPAVLAQTLPASLPGSLQTNRMLDGWLRINADGTVTVFTGKVELGQGILTALAQIAADELDVAYDRVEMISADTSRSPNEGMTAGSQSVEQSGTALHYAAAEARQILLQLAAARLGVGVESLSVSDGTVSAAGAKTTYWELAQNASFKREASARAKPKTAAQRNVIGKSVPRRDIPKKVRAEAVYVQDMRLPAMVFGRVVRPPSRGAQLEALDEAAVRAMPGVVALARDGNFLAVVAEREEQAIRAAEKMRAVARWQETAVLPPTGMALYDHLLKLPSQDSVVSAKSGGAGGGQVSTIEATYTRPYQCHASIGPSCAVAQWQDGKLVVWTHSQGVYPLRQHLARLTGLTEANVTAVHVEGSGCYGHNGADDVAADAALLARATGGRPVKLQWMREDEFGWEPYGSPMVMKMKARLDAGGKVVDWRHDVWSHPHSTRPGGGGTNLLAGASLAKPQSLGNPVNTPQPSGAADRNAVPLYDFPSQRVTLHYLPEMPLRTSALRTLGAYANVFALESFIDELALAAGADPVEFRLRHMQDARARAVIEVVAQKAGWKPSTKGDGTRGRGFAFAKYKNLAAYVAMVVDVEIERPSGKVHVRRAYAAVDAGMIVNPDGVKNQIEGGIVQSTSWTLKEQLRYDARKVLTRSWSDYPILTFAEVPAVEVVLLDRPDEKSLGTGEGSQGPTVAAIANAIANASGRRVRDLPFTPAVIKAALA